MRSTVADPNLMAMRHHADALVDKMGAITDWPACYTAREYSSSAPWDDAHAKHHPRHAGGRLSTFPCLCQE